MERPAPALIGSVLVHAAVIGAVLLAMMFNGGPPQRQIVNAVPVSIVSSQMVLAGPADAPSEDPAVDTASAPPVEAPEPPPPTPTPVPTPRPPEKAVTPRPTPRPVPPRRPSTPPPAERRETPRPREETLDLGKLAAERRNNSPRRDTRPPSGQQAGGTAGQTSGPVITAMFEQVYPNWTPPCQTPGAEDLRIQMDVTLDSRGRITDGPTLVGARNESVWRAVAAGAMQAVVRTAPFDVPAGFTGGEYRATFLTRRMCGG